jgi:SAM-dependent methyltransferase
MRRPRRPTEDETAFVVRIYETLLGRPPDDAGLAGYLQQLADGRAREDIVLELATSREYANRFVPPRKRRPDQYRLALDRSRTSAFLAFDVGDDADYDWLESVILADGYYDTPGAWSYVLDDDKRIMADLIARFEPTRALELGCSSGAVLAALADLGIEAEGVELSHDAAAHARPDVKDRIHVGDILDVDLRGGYDLVFGLDVFEHLNPNRIARYLDTVRALLVDGGRLFAVVPAFGTDEVFGEVFPLYLDEWDADVAANRPFRTLHCDPDGYPMHGHLIWAHTSWWVAQFERAGFTRDPGAEREIHARYADHFAEEPARQSCYVFSAQ